MCNKRAWRRKLGSPMDGAWATEACSISATHFPTRWPNRSMHRCCLLGTTSRLPTLHLLCSANSPRLEAFGGVDREIGQDAVGAGALEAEEALHHRPLAVEPAALGGGADHRIFAADLVDEGRHPEGVLHPAHDIEIGQARLDHDHVGAFLQVERNL